MYCTHLYSVLCTVHTSTVSCVLYTPLQCAVYCTHLYSVLCTVHTSAVCYVLYTPLQCAMYCVYSAVHSVWWSLISTIACYSYSWCSVRWRGPPGCAVWCSVRWRGPPGCAVWCSVRWGDLLAVPSGVV